MKSVANSLPFANTRILSRIILCVWGGVALFINVLCCPIMCHYALSSCRYDFHIKTMFISSLPPVFCRRAHVLFTLFLLACVQWDSTYIVLCFFCFACPRLVYPMLPVSLDCPILLARSVFSYVYLKTNNAILLTFRTQQNLK